jgi:hypothetical protein
MGYGIRDYEFFPAGWLCEHPPYGSVRHPYPHAAVFEPQEAVHGPHPQGPGGLPQRLQAGHRVHASQAWTAEGMGGIGREDQESEGIMLNPL